MQSETTTNPENLQFIHKLSAGAIPTDESIEIFADREHRKVYFTSKGVTLEFKKLSQRYKNRLFEKLLADTVAYKDLAHLPDHEALEKYAYCVYGTIDHIPDISTTGLLGGSENFMCGNPDCNCKNWLSKEFSYKGKILKGRILDVLIAYRKGREDQHVCDELDITMPTLNSHKKKLFEIFEVFSKTELVVAAIEAQIIQ